MGTAPLVSNVSDQELTELFDIKYRGGSRLGSDPARRLAWGYFTPDDIYEALVRRLVNPSTVWLDVGCGRDLFPSNRRLARELSECCERLVGVDPDVTIEENPFVHEKVRGFIQDLEPVPRFHLVTMRMVAEHVVDPTQLIDALSTLVIPSGLVVVYTINQWSPVPMVTWATPFSFHHPVKRILWGTEEKDTFPVEYRMNTRRELRRLMEAGGFQEEGFWYLDDCRSLQRFRLLNVLELSLWWALSRVGLHYPENCLLGVYRRGPA